MCVGEGFGASSFFGNLPHRYLILVVAVISFCRNIKVLLSLETEQEYFSVDPEQEYLNI